MENQIVLSVGFVNSHSKIIVAFITNIILEDSIVFGGPDELQKMEQWKIARKYIITTLTMPGYRPIVFELTPEAKQLSKKFDDIMLNVVAEDIQGNSYKTDVLYQRKKKELKTTLGHKDQTDTILIDKCSVNVEYSPFNKGEVILNFTESTSRTYSSKANPEGDSFVGQYYNTFSIQYIGSSSVDVKVIVQ